MRISGGARPPVWIAHGVSKGADHVAQPRRAAARVGPDLDDRARTARRVSDQWLRPSCPAIPRALLLRHMQYVAAQLHVHALTGRNYAI
jgi:hypothetical protein